MYFVAVCFAAFLYCCNWSQAECGTCQCPLTVKHILMDYVDFTYVRNKHFVASSIKDLFKNVDAQNMVDFIKETGFCRAMLCISAAYAIMRCLWVCLSHSCIVSKRIKIFRFFSPSGSHTILVIPHQTEWQYSDGNPRNGGIECRWNRLKSRNQWLSGLAINNRCMYFTLCGRLFVYGWYWTTKRDRRAAVYRTRSTKRGLALYTVTVDVNRVWQQGWTLCRRQQNRIELYAAGKSEAEVTSKKTALEVLYYWS